MPLGLEYVRLAMAEIGVGRPWWVGLGEGKKRGNDGSTFAKLDILVGGFKYPLVMLT